MPRQLVINLSMYNQSKSGMNKFSENIAGMLEEIYPSIIIAGHYKPVSAMSKIIAAPIDIGINSGIIPAFKRLFVKYDLSQYPNKVIYSPTHHNIFSEKNLIITIHDFISYSSPKQHPLQYLYFKFYLPLLVKKCAYILTVSETVKQKIATSYHFPLERIFVVPNYVPNAEPSSGNNRMKLNRKYLLVVGASYPHKNIEEFLRNNSFWKDKYNVKIIGPANAYQKQLKNIVEQDRLLDKVEFLSGVPQSMLTLYYENCEALVYPSIDEGFGIPPLEALMYGKPTIISNIPVHKEIFDKAAIFVELGNTNSWQKAFATLEDGNAVAKILTDGKMILEKYSQQRVKETVKKVFDQILIEQ